ncbi:nwd2 [Moniliophthora roreri]|nr:nwd2 [Moniliophthora roreri]
MSFNNSQAFHIFGGVFTNVESGGQKQPADPALYYLSQAIYGVGAGHNAEKRSPPPKCHPDTRRDVLDILHNWSRRSSSEDHILWLYGPAGAGKSAIAQTLAEQWQSQNRLASSFFFSRRDGTRNTGASLFLTIAYGLVVSIPDLREPILDVIRKDPDVLQTSLEEQFQRLIVEPCRSLEPSSVCGWVIVIDGLDECIEKGQRHRVLSILAKALPNAFPFRLLICSRPEPLIQEVFNTQTLRPFSRRVALNSEIFQIDHDIKIFLTHEFERIRTLPRNAHIQFTSSWPACGIIDELVKKASGQFLYAAAIVKFVENEYCHPCEQLEFVLHARSHSYQDSHSPFHELDNIYHQILTTNARRSEVRDVLRALLSISRIHTDHDRHYFPPSPRYIEALLLLREGSVLPTFHGMHSILSIGGTDGEIRILHPSFYDFLHDAARSGDFFVGTEQDQHGYLACQLLRAINHYSQLCEGNQDQLRFDHGTVLRTAWSYWGYHCSKSNLNEKVVNTLRKIDFKINLESHLTSYLQTKSDKLGIQHFFREAELVIQCLRTNLECGDIVCRLSDYRRGFRVAVSLPDTSDVALSKILDAVATALGFLLVGGTWTYWMELDDRLRMLAGTYLDFSCQSEQLRVISIGNDCACTRAREASSRLSLPCVESTSNVDVYHIQLSASVRNLTRIAMRNVSEWQPQLQTGRLTRSPAKSTDAPYCQLHKLLDFCGPSSELLDLVPPLLAKIESKMDQEDVLKWLQSFPSEYTPQTAPLIEQIRRASWIGRKRIAGGSGTELESEDRSTKRRKES